MRWLFVLFIIPAQAQFFETPQNITSSPCTDRNHMFLAPGVLTAGGNSRACVSRFHTDGAARFVLTLTTDDGGTVSASRDLVPGDGGCLDISVPLKPNTKAELNVNIRYPEASCAWDRRLTVRIASGRVVIVHTERGRYRPGDTVRFRAVALKADLTPAHTTIEEVWLEGPRGAWDGVKSAQWQRVRTRLGLAQLQHQLDELAPPGRWTVRARLADGSQGSTSFSVGNYELPPFQLTVRHAPIVLRTSERLVWTVCVRYPWSEAVEGMLVIRLRGAGGSGQGQGGIRTAVRLKAPRACHRHAAATKRIGLDGISPPDVIVADFSFQEEGTRLWQNTTVISQVVDDPVKLEFLTKHRAVISPGLPYKIKVKASRWDDKPAVNERVIVCRSPALTPEESAFNTTKASCVDSITDAKGIGRVMFTAEDDGKPYYHFQARLFNATAHLVTRCSSTQGRAALGALRTDARSRTLLPLYLNLGHLTQPVTVHFVVITRGGVIYRWGATTQCPMTSVGDQIHTTDRNSICSNRSFQKLELPNKILEGRNSSELDTLLDRHLSKVMLPIKVSNQMCPDSHLIAYFYHNNELITANKHFEMEECFANKVEAVWTARQTLPGSVASLQVSTPGPALCALTVLDTASKWVQPPESVKNLMMIGLRKLIDGHRNITEHDASEECFLTASDTPDLPSSSIEHMSTWLASAGVRVLGSAVPQARCSVAPAPLMAEDASVPRNDFSESWLWRLAAIGTNGTVTVSARAPDSISRFEASAFCLAKNGVSVSQPAVLQVFREFFIHADGPRRLRRGDTAIIPYRIFNYLYQALSMKLQISTDSHLNSSTNAETVCIQPRSSIAKRLEVAAKQNGAARLRIKASTVRDHLCTNDTSGKDVSDEVVIRIDVDPQGVPTQEHKSAMLCAKEIYSLKNQPTIWKWSQIKAVLGTESVTVWAVGNTIAPLLADADALVQLPRGCGEQNMARLATNLLALSFLEPTSTSAAIAKDHVARGFTRQLQYVHPSGGFSAFGAADASASTWLTAFCLRYLRKAYRVISGEAPVPPAILQAEQWLRAQQMENGCFRNQGHVFHHELKGGLDEEGEISSVALTAYVITSLLETAPLSSKLLKNTLSCLRALPPSKSKSKVNPLRIYAHSIVTYSLMRLRRYEEEVRSTNEAFLRLKSDAGLEQDEELRELLELLRMAKRTEDYVWWETGNLATSVEATGYALLALWECPPALRENCAADVAGATRWLATHRNAAGGFISTQDTLVALEGLSRWSTLLPSVNNVTVTIQSGPHRKELHLDASDKLPEIAKIPVTDQLKISVQGTGCALVQATRFYNTLEEHAEQQNSLSVQVNAQTDGAFNCDQNTVCFCAAVVEVCVVWAGPFPEMALLEVGLPGGFGADAAALYSQLQQNDTLLRRIELSPNSGKATLYLGTRDGSDTISRAGNQCYKIHAVGPKARTKPAHAKVLDYYRPHIKDTQMYTISEDCPSRITHDTSNYHKSDNLFSRAKSLTDSEEILITHEFSFEDIPEGIPLEDPLYDNLTKRNQNEDTEGHTHVENQVVNIENNNNQNKNNITNEVKTSESIKDENEIPKEKEYVTKYINVNDISNTRNTNIDINYTKDDIRLNESIKDENQITKQNEYYMTNISAVVTDLNTDTKEKNKNIYDETRLKESEKDENEIPKENDYTTNTNPFINNINNYGLDKVKNIVTTNDYENLVTKEINTTIDMQNESKVSNEVIRDTTSELLGNNKHDVKEKLKLHNTEEKLAVSNPSFTDFHVIDSEKDLDVPTGIEGPIPAIVLPPKNFVAPQDIVLPVDALPTWRKFSEVPYNPYYYQRPYYFKQNYYNNYKPVLPLY